MNKFSWLKFLIAALVVTAAVMICNGVTLDNDSWYILAEGREIVNNGLYYTDQLSMHEGLNVTVQNYGFATIFYLLYSAFGVAGTYIAFLILNLVLLYLIYKVIKVISKGNVNLALLLAVLTDLLLGRWFIVTRAQVVSYIFLMLVIYLLELYIAKKNSKYLWWLPVISLVQINIHGSMWPMLLIVTSVYIIDSLGIKKLRLDKYKTRPLILALFMMVLVGFLNPYGLKMMTFILTSFGVPEAENYIGEMKPFVPLDGIYNMLFSIMVAVVMGMMIFGKSQKIRIRWLILIFGFMILGISSNRGIAQVILVLMLPLAAMYDDFKLKRKYRKICWMEVSWAGIIGLCGMVALGVICLPEMVEGPGEVMIKAVDFLDEETAGLNKNDLKIYAGYDEGGYLEYRGYKAYLDPRMEVFIKANNGKEDIFQEYYRLQNGEIKENDFLKKYEFDYLVTIDGESLHRMEEGEYQVIYESEEKNEEENRALVMVWKRA